MTHMATNRREPSDFSMAAAAQVRAERSARRMTQEDVFHAAGIPRSTYVKIEAGTHVTDVSELARITSALGMTLSEFFLRVERDRLALGNGAPPE